MVRWEPDRKAAWRAYEEERDFKKFKERAVNIIIGLVVVACLAIWFMFGD